jgi:phosphatidylserine decarboxylase
MYLTKYGIREWLGSLIIAFILISILLLLSSRFKMNFLTYLACFVFICWCSIAAFFRDPERRIPTEGNILVSPADGTVKDIEVVRVPEYSEIFGDAEVLRIGIFLSVFNVHLNRAPCDMIVNRVIYKEGKFYDARDGRAIKENESNSVLCKGNVSGFEFPLVVKQISGAIARRIVCPVNINDKFKRGDRFGMIKFGSRTEVYLSKNEKFITKLSIGDKLKAGESPIVDVKK